MSKGYRSAEMSTRVVYLADTNIGGAQRTMINIINQWHRMGVNFELVIGNNNGGATTWLDASIPYHNLKVTRQLLALPKLVLLFWRLKPNVVFTTLTHANIIVMLATLFVPLAIKVSVRETNNPAHVFAHRPVLKLLASMLYPKAHRVIALSRQVRDELAAKFSIEPARLVALPNPVDLSPPEDDALITPLPSGQFMLTVGRLNAQKNLPMLIAAYAEIDALPPLYIIGDGEQRKELITLVDQLGLKGQVHFIRHEDNVLAWMAGADMFVLASSWEGFGHVVVEAMSQGCPVIATACAGPIDIIANNKNGLLVPIDDIAALKAAIKKLNASGRLRQRLGQAAITRAKHYDAAKVSQHYLDVIGG